MEMRAGDAVQTPALLVLLWPRPRQTGMRGLHQKAAACSGTQLQVQQCQSVSLLCLCKVSFREPLVSDESLCLRAGVFT